MNLKQATRLLAPVLIAGILVVAVSGVVTGQDELTSDQSRQVRRIKTGIDRAGRLFNSGKASESAELIKQFASDLEKLVDGGSDALLAAARPQHERLVAARKALVDAGQTLPAIADLPPPSALAGDTVSFSSDVAGILVANCGGCHVAQARGEFSMANWSALASGLGGSPVIVPGKPDESYLIEVIRTGTMPKGGGTVPEADLQRLKQWIEEGANFDSDDPARDLRTIADASRQAMAEAVPEIAAPRGNETISFSLDVAPVLVDNCVGCHFEARNVRGGLMVDNFRQFLRGGDSGNLVTPGDGAGSLLVQRLRAGDNSRMPQGRPPLDPSMIDRIAKWIDEGARFDGRDPQMNLRTLAAIARSVSASHEELVAARADSARRTWRKVMPDVEGHEAETADFHLVGTADVEALEPIAKFAQAQAVPVREFLGIEERDPLVKGKTTLFVFQRRYDFNEFGKMIENRDLPQTAKSHWNYDVVDAYVALHVSGNVLGDEEPLLQQSIAAVAVSAQGSDVPRWFADGAGYLIAETLVDNRSLVREWQSAAAAAASSMESPTDFLRQRMSGDEAGLVAYGFVKSLFSSRRQFEGLIGDLRTGAPFAEVFSKHFSATPVELIERQYDSRQRNGRNRGKR